MLIFLTYSQDYNFLSQMLKLLINYSGYVYQCFFLYNSFRVPKFSDFIYKRQLNIVIFNNNAEIVN